MMMSERIATVELAREESTGNVYKRGATVDFTPSHTTGGGCYCAHAGRHSQTNAVPMHPFLVHRDRTCLPHELTVMDSMQPKAANTLDIAPRALHFLRPQALGRLGEDNFLAAAN